MKEKKTVSDLPSAPPSSGSKSYRILVVDDEKAVRNLHLELLTRAGYEVIAVADGALAWEAIQTQHFDLMITDNSMPKITGVEMINKMIAVNIGLPVIMATGALPPHEFSRNPWLSTVAVLEKPVSNSTLLSAVLKILNEKDNIPNNKIDPKELAATMIENTPPDIVSKEEKTDKVEASFDEEAALSERPESRMETESILNKDALRSSEIRYRRLFEAARDGILILNVETGRITDVNPFLIEILGFSKSEMIGKTVGELSPFKDIEPNQVMLDRLKREGYVRYEHLPLENKDGRHIAVEFVCNIYQEDTAPVIQCNIRDITERKYAEDQKKQFSLELEKRVLERTAELEAFSGAVSHDLQAPLRHLASYLGAPHGQARVNMRRNCCSAGSRAKKCVVRKSIGSKGRHFTGAGSASSLARLGAWFFPESDEVIGEIAAAGCRNQPGEKSENKIAGKPMPSRRKGKLLCQRHANNGREKKDPTLTAQLLSARPEVATASQAKATGEGPSSLLPTQMLPGSILELKFIM